MFQLLCPVCGAPLRREERVYHCEKRHSFDIARSGYVNLLPPTPAGKRHGDDRLMVDARTSFLSRGHYRHLEDALAALAEKYAPLSPRILDAGCGEGTYTKAVHDRLFAQGKPPRMLGIDISAAALKRAARALPSGVFCAASTAHLPLASESTDLILNIFSPLMPEEFRRVLTPNGVLIRAVPLERHLYELKALVYDTPYENPPFDPAVAGFAPIEQLALTREITLNTHADVENLFRMTPYYYKTGADDQKKLENVSQLRLTTAFGIAVYKKL